MQASGLTDFTAFICTSAIWGQSCFLVHFASCIPQLLSNHPTGWQHPLGQSLGALIHIWRPEIIDGYDISYLLICQEIFKFHTHTHTHIHILTYGFPGSSDGKESACNAGDLDFILGLGSFDGEGNGYPVQYSFLENPMDRGV